MLPRVPLPAGAHPVVLLLSLADSQRGVGKRRPAASPVACLARLTKHLKAAPYVASLKLIDTAKVPVLKLAMDSEGVLFNVDITVDGQNTPHSGLMAW